MLAVKLFRHKRLMRCVSFNPYRVLSRRQGTEALEQVRGLPEVPQRVGTGPGIRTWARESSPDSSLTHLPAPPAASSILSLCSYSSFMFLNIFLSLISQKLYRHIYSSSPNSPNYFLKGYASVKCHQKTNKKPFHHILTRHLIFF